MFVEYPNLPEDAASVLVDCRTPERIVKKLEQMGITCCKGVILEEIHPAVAGHVDMQIVHVGGNTFVCEPRALRHYETMWQEKNARLLAGNRLARRNYPEDVAYNIVSVGAYAFHLDAATDEVARRELSRRGVKWETVRQGYSKCSVCVVSQNALITGDKGIAKKAAALGIDVLCIETEKIRLPGMNAGLIGGAGGKLKKDLLAFTGDIKRLGCGQAIEAFCHAHGVRIVCLDDGDVLDIGSIIPITERK